MGVDNDKLGVVLQTLTVISATNQQSSYLLISHHQWTIAAYYSLSIASVNLLLSISTV
jgi:hypothetical protein